MRAFLSNDQFGLVLGGDLFELSRVHDVAIQTPQPSTLGKPRQKRGLPALNHIGALNSAESYFYFPSPLSAATPGTRSYSKSLRQAAAHSVY
jgi:hypothetical protein